MRNIQIGQLIKKLRNKKKLSMVDFASKINISQPALSKIETGMQEVSLTILDKICKECNITMIDFFKMLEDEIDLSINTIEKNKIDNPEKLEYELINIIKSINYEQQKALYIVLFPYKK